MVKQIFVNYVDTLGFALTIDTERKKTCVFTWCFVNKSSIHVDEKGIFTLPPCFNNSLS